MNFWKEWTAINIARLNSIFSSENVKFHAVEFSDRLVLVQSGKRRHIQPTYFVDSIRPAEVLATIDFVKSESGNNSQISAAIPALECESNYFQETLSLSTHWKRSTYYAIALSGATAQDVLAGMDSRQRTKIRSNASNFSVEVVDLKEMHALIFERQQIEWGISKSNFFSASFLMSIASRFQTRLWQVTCVNSEILYIFNVECFPEAFFFLSATTNSSARGAALFAHWAIIKSLIESNHILYHLGGGVKSGDGIERFKQSLGANEISRHLYPFSLNVQVAGDFFPNWLEWTHLPLNVKST